MADIKACPFCGGMSNLKHREPDGHWGNGYHPQHEEYVVQCDVCHARGPAIQCKTFAAFTKFTCSDFRAEPNNDLYKREYAKWQAYSADCDDKAIGGWNITLRLKVRYRLQENAL